MSSRIKNKNAPHTIYGIMCTETKRVYIGNTTHFESRIRTHFAELERHDKKSTARWRTGPTVWQQDYDKYGKGSFKVYKIATGLNEEEAIIEEQRLIDMYDSLNPEKGYNLSPARKQTITVDIIEGMPPV